AAASPRTQQLASLIAEGGQPDQTPAVGMPAAPSPDSGATAPATPAGPQRPLTQKELLAQALNSSNKYVKAWAMNRALAEADAQTKRDAELDKEFATKGLRRVANADGTYSVVKIGGYGEGVGDLEATKYRALTGPTLERSRGEQELKLEYEP